MKTHRRLLLAVAVLIGAGVAAVAADGDVDTQAPRPLEIQPTLDEPSAEYLELRRNAIPQPSGDPDALAPVPLPPVASPQR